VPKKTEFRIEGLSELVDALEELPKATSTNVQKRVLAKAGEPIRKAAQALAPYRTGLLRRTIVVSSQLSPRAKRSHKQESKIEYFVGPPSMARAIVAEFGSVKQTPQPFMRPAWDSNKRTAFDSIRGDLTDEIEKARQRAARKTAKFLTK
jgi:HK97 gp10 family phage protein